MPDLIGNGLMFLVIALLVLLLVRVWIRLRRDPISQARRRIEEEMDDQGNYRGPQG